MIIGISGKIGSGKDTVGKIIQYLVYRNNLALTNVVDLRNFEIYCNSLTPITSDFKIMKFADYLKDIVCGLINCTREQLENPVFKDTELGEEWTRYGYADGFVQRNGITTMCNVSCTKEKYEEQKRINWQTAYKTTYTPRLLLQYIGTELFRNQLLNGVWVNALMSKYIIDYNTYAGEVVRDSYPNWIITDVRFPNELQAVKDRGGVSIRVNRGRTGGEILEDKNSEHPSETSLDTATFDYTIDNNGSIEDLIAKVKEILIKEKII